MSILLTALTWAVTHPDNIIKGADYVVGLVNDIIAGWQRAGKPAESTDQLQAEWTAEGVDYAAIMAEADRRGL